MSDSRTLARRIADTMLKGEGTGPNFGIRVEDADVGYSKISMTVRDDMLNSHMIAHGGLIFLLADTAFAYACNSHNQRAVAQHAQISFLAPGKLGTTLTAEASERQRGDRSGIYDITVRDDAGTTIAEFRGWSRSIPGTFF